MERFETMPAKRKAKRFVFTEARLAKYPRPLKGSVYIYDEEEAGLAARLTPSTSTYVFVKWYNGGPDRLTVGRVVEISLRQARAISAGYRGDLARGVNVFAAARLAKATSKPITLTDAYNQLLARPDMRLSTRRDYTSLWTRVPARLKTRALTDVGKDELEKLHNEVGVKHPRTANKLMALLSVLFTRGGRSHDNPAAGVRRFAEEARQRILTIEELLRLRDEFKVEAEPWRSFFLLAMLTGARRGALARMQWADVDLEAAVWRVPAIWSKNRRVLTLALPTEAVSVLRNLRETRGAASWVFPSRSEAGHLTEPKKAWARICCRAGIAGAHIHDLRRTLGTAVAADGNGAAIISAVLGHVSIQSAKSYLHLSAEMARDAVERAARRSKHAT